MNNRPWRKLYSTPEWQSLRIKIFIRDNYTCQDCGVITTDTNRHSLRAAIADHIKPHKGDVKLFFDPDNIQTLCKRCHDSHKQSQEKLGYSKEIGLDGWPVDEKHPINSGTRKQKYSIPHYIQPSNVLLHIVHGAPGSGKTTYIRKHAKPDDLIIDFDDIRQSFGGSRYDNDPKTLKRAYKIRADLLKSLHTRTQGEAWLAIMAPTRAERKSWERALVKVKLHHINTDKKTCLERVSKDPERKGQEEQLLKAIDRYFRKHN